MYDVCLHIVFAYILILQKSLCMLQFLSVYNYALFQHVLLLLFRSIFSPPELMNKILDYLIFNFTFSQILRCWYSTDWYLFQICFYVKQCWNHWRFWFILLSGPLAFLCFCMLCSTTSRGPICRVPYKQLSSSVIPFSLVMYSS